MNRFQDKHKVLADFYKEVWVVCPSCQHKAVATTVDEARVRLYCASCGYQKERSTSVVFQGEKVQFRTSADFFFETELWLQVPFKGDRFFAYNLEHLEYLETYIAASLREHKNRTGFTLLERLPKFYHDAKNRTALLKLIEKLKRK